MKGLKVNREGHNVLGYRLQFSHHRRVSAARWRRRSHRIYGGGENDVRGFDIRSSSPYTFIPNKVQFNLTNPDGTTVPRDPTNPALGNVRFRCRSTVWSRWAATPASPPTWSTASRS